MGILYVVGTPIGNLGDMTYRAVETLKKVDFICAEDTRVTAKLINHFEIKTPLVSFHEHSASPIAHQIVQRLADGENAAIVTDAGMPCISDPGEPLVKLCYENGIGIEVVPGACAAVSALAISGLSTSKFQFEGFLTVTKHLRYEHLAKIKNCTNTLIFYEAPHKLLRTLKDMNEYLGDRQISLCRELTKIHEEVFRTTISQAVEYYKINTPKGEFVLIVEGAAEDAGEVPQTIEEALEQVKSLVEKGMRATDACREIAKESGFSKGDLYTRLVESKLGREE